MSKLVLNDIEAGYLTHTAYNANNTLIETALENTLSRNGTTPNQMGAAIDMNSFRLLNVGTPGTQSDGARLADVTAAVAGLPTLTSDMVNHVASGTGAVVTTTQAKLREYVSVKDYGAVGNGTTDDTTAIQAAITAVAVSGGSVYIPPGTYKITVVLSIPANVSIFGAGGGVSTISCLSCGGLKFTSASYDNGSVFFEDFGLLGHVGSSANQTAIESTLPSGGVYGTDSRDGLHFSRLKIREFNIAFNIAATWEWEARNCSITKINRAFVLGNYTLVSRITQNYAIYEGGCSYGGTATAIGVYAAGPVCEDITIHENEIFGFNTDIQLVNTIFADIVNNDLEALQYGVVLGTVNNGLNIKNNYIQIDGTAGIAGIWVSPLGSAINSQINIEGNNLIALGTTTCLGIKLADSGQTYAFHVRIVGNLFSGFSNVDIYAYNPGKTTIENNRCLSTGAASSITIGAIQSAPVSLINNECIGTINYTATDLTTGKLLLNNNTASGTFIPYRGSWTPSFVPDAGAFTSITYAANREGDYVRIGDKVYVSGYIRTDAITVGTASGPIYISGLPFITSAKVWRDQGSIGYTDAFNVNHPSTIKTVPSTDRLAFNYSTTANGAQKNALLVSDLATGASSNFMFFSIEYTV